MTDIVPLHLGESDSPAAVLRDVMASAQAGDVQAVIVIGLNKNGDVMTAWSGIDNGLFSLMGGLTYMQNKLAHRIED